MLHNYHNPRCNILEKASHHNFEAWAVAIGAAVAVAGTAYGVYQSQASINAANSVKLPKFIPIDIAQVAGLAAATDKTGYDISDADWAARFPALDKGRNYSIAEINNAMTPRPDPQVTNALAKSGLTADIGGNPFEQAVKLNLPILSKEQRDRTYFQKVLGDNPQRQFGLSGSDVAHIAIANTNSQNNFNQGLFGSRINAYNASIQQNAQATQGIVSGVGGLANIGAQLYQNNQLSTAVNQPSSLSPDFYESNRIALLPKTDPAYSFDPLTPGG